MDRKTKADLLLVILMFMLPSFSFDTTYDVRCMNKTHAICCGEKCLWTCQFNINEDANCTAHKNGNMKCVPLVIDKNKIVGPENFCLNLKFEDKDNCLITRDERKTKDSSISTFITNCKNDSTTLCCNQTCNWSAPQKCDLTLKNANCNEEGCQEGKSFISDVKQCGFKEKISKGVTCTITEVYSKGKGADKSVVGNGEGADKRAVGNGEGAGKSGNLCCLLLGAGVGVAVLGFIVLVIVKCYQKKSKVPKPKNGTVQITEALSCSKRKGSGGGGDNHVGVNEEGAGKSVDGNEEGAGKSGTANKPGESSVLLEGSALLQNQNPHRRSPRK